MTTNQNQTDSRTAAEATARPDLYGGTYWGSFRPSRNPEIDADIISNRDRFAAEWRIKSRCHASIPHPQTAGTLHDYDHAELYRDEGGWFVLLVSNYGDGIPPPAILGMRKIPPLYSTDATSYAGRYATLKELRARLEAVASGSGGEKFGAARHLFAEPPTPRRKRLRSRSKATA